MKLQITEPAAALALYAKLHDGLSEMIEEGRLTEADIPDDYQWLVDSLAELAALWQMKTKIVSGIALCGGGILTFILVLDLPRSAQMLGKLIWNP